MNKFFRVSFLAVALFSLVILAGCDDEDPPLPDNKATFQSNAQGLAGAESEITVNLALVRAVDADGTITISYAGTGVVYGDDFITDPVDDNGDGKIVVPVVAGATSASFKVTKTNTTGLEGSEKVVFTIDTVSDGLVLGDQKTFTLTFSEIIATSAAMQINGGGTNAQNRVFIDLSGNRQIAVARNTWDLAFASGAEDFRVYLNSSDKMLARAIDKDDLTEVTSADTVGFAAQVDLNAIFSTLLGGKIPDWAYGATAWMDNPLDPAATAIAEINEDDDENLVYIVNRGYSLDNEKLGWLKVRVLRDGSNYAIQYGDINSSTFQTKVIEKNAATNLTYFSFHTDDVVTVEPNTGDWDIAWTGLTNELGVGPGGSIPYYFADMIIQNTNGVSTAQVLTADIAYDAYAESNIATTEFNGDNQINIGDKWRTLGQSGSSLNEDRYYIIKDADGNVYKLQFTALIVAGERGKPEFKFDLVKKGS